MPTWKTEEFLRKLKGACDCFDTDECEALCHQLVTHLRTSVKTYEATDAKKVLEALRRKRNFQLMAFVADAFLRSGVSVAHVRRQYAQSLLDQGTVFPALAMLVDTVNDQQTSSKERAEARGLIGRAYKQIYVDANDARPPQNREALRKAISAYHDVYDENPEGFSWHGINAVALIKRAERDGVELDDAPDANAIVQQIIDDLGEDDARNASMWDLATLAEACVARGDMEQAATYLGRYVTHKSDAFELASTLRQFEQVWMLDEEDMQARALLDLLRSHLLKRSGGEVLTSAQNVSSMLNTASIESEQLEKVLGESGYQSYQWLLGAMRNARSVGRIWHGPDAIGTGFLLDGAALCSEWTGQQVFITNNHVMSNPLSHAIAVLPEQVQITFDVLDGGIDADRYEVVEVLWQSPVAEFDATIAVLDTSIDDVDSYRIARSMPQKKGTDRVYAIGHPRGGEISFSFQDNMLIDFDDRRMHYRTPTEGGSSGSPLFNEKWELIGLHHSGSETLKRINGNGTYAANEGLQLPAIIEQIAREEH